MLALYSWFTKRERLQVIFISPTLGFDRGIMKEINKSSIRFLPPTLITLSLLLAVITCAKTIKYKLDADSIPESIKAALNASSMNDEEVSKLQKRFSDVAATLKKKSIFAPPPPGKKNPVTKVDAILGDEALINNKWYKAGDNIGEVKVLSIGFAEITIEWNGKETKLSPIAAPTKYAVVPKNDSIKKDAANKTESTAAVAQTQTVVQATTETVDEFAWMKVKMSPELRAIMIKKWNALTDEQKAEGKKRWESMPDSQKQMMVNQMEMNKHNM
jgi:hypothetical protein